MTYLRALLIFKGAQETAALSYAFLYQDKKAKK